MKQNKYGHLDSTVSCRPVLDRSRIPPSLPPPKCYQIAVLFALPLATNSVLQFLGTCPHTCTTVGELLSYSVVVPAKMPELSRIDYLVLISTPPPNPSQQHFSSPHSIIHQLALALQAWYLHMLKLQISTSGSHFLASWCERGGEGSLSYMAKM